MNIHELGLRKKLLEICDKEIEWNIKDCSSWSKSDDQGACAYHQIEPLRAFKKYIEAYKDMDKEE